MFFRHIHHTDFYPRPPRGGRPVVYDRVPDDVYFYPRPPRGGRRLLQLLFLVHSAISIHALREEGDHVAQYGYLLGNNFYPRPPRGGRPGHTRYKAAKKLFLSTPSARRATASGAVSAQHIEISIHALREEGDQGIPATKPPRSYFYPRPPRGGRPQVERFRLSI